MSKLRKSLDKATFRFEDVDVCLDGEAGVARDRLYKELGEAADVPRATMGPPATVEVQARIDALEETMREDLVTLRFRALSFDRWNAIIALRPPREGVAVEEATENRDRLVQPVAALAEARPEVVAVVLVLDVEPRRADAEDRAAIADVVDRRRHLRD